jgi:hypothetical protein
VRADIAKQDPNRYVHCQQSYDPTTTACPSRLALHQALITCFHSTTSLVQHSIDLIPILHVQLQKEEKMKGSICVNLMSIILWMCNCVHEHVVWERYLIRSLLSTESTTIKQEGNWVELNGLAITIGIHQLLQLCASFDPEKYFISILNLKSKHVFL